VEPGTFTVRIGNGEDCEAGCATGCNTCAQFALV
jgi:hypothetical protein